MYFFDRFFASGFRFFFCRKSAYPYSLVVYSDSCTPFSGSFVLRYADASRSVVFIHTFITTVLSMCCFSQIIPAVVEAFSVFVINFVFGKFSCNYCPYYNGYVIIHFIDFDRKSIAAVFPTCCFTNVFSVPLRRLIWSIFPSQYACLFTVRQNRAYVLSSEVVAKMSALCFKGCSHGTLSSSRRLGAVESARNAFLPRFYIAGAP